MLEGLRGPEANRLDVTACGSGRDSVRFWPARCDGGPVLAGKRLSHRDRTLPRTDIPGAAYFYVAARSGADGIRQRGKQWEKHVGTGWSRRWAPAGYWPPSSVRRGPR